jgi:hypothetical protein
MTAQCGRINHADGTRPGHTTQVGPTIRGVKAGWASDAKPADARNNVDAAT